LYELREFKATTSSGREFHRQAHLIEKYLLLASKEQWGEGS